MKMMKGTDFWRETIKTNYEPSCQPHGKGEWQADCALLLPSGESSMACDYVKKH